MIKFFRKIRQKMQTENKFNKYFLYAIGEIVLVVVGILIALGINNWNDQKKNNQVEAQYYCKVLDDLELDKKLLEELSKKADNRISLSKELLLDLDSGKKDKKYLLNSFLTAVRSNNYVPRNMTFKDLISSGNIKLFKDCLLYTSPSPRD